MKIGIVGAGNLAEAMVKVFLKNRSLSASEVSVYDINNDKLNYWAGTYDVMPCTDLDSLVQNSQILFIAVNGSEFQKLIPNVDFLLKTYRPLVVSLTRGKKLEEIEDLMDFITPMARVITNLNIEVSSGITAYCFNELVTDEQKGTLIELFSATGTLVEVEESQFDAFAALSTAISSFSCCMIESLVTCAVNSGLPRNIAMKTAIQCLFGTSKMLLDTGLSTSAMLDKLSPLESMTADGLLILKENGFDKAVIRGYKAAYENSN